MTPEEYEKIQYARVSALGYFLTPTGDAAYPFQILGKDDEVVRDKLRNAQDVAEWVDAQEGEESDARDSFTSES
jgi:hypothetical protein